MFGLTEDEVKSIFAEIVDQDDSKAEIDHVLNELAISYRGQSDLEPKDTEIITMLAFGLDRVTRSWIERAVVKIVLENNRRLAEQLGRPE